MMIININNFKIFNKTEIKLFHQQKNSQLKNKMIGGNL